MPVALGWLAVPLLSLYLAVYPAIATAAAFMMTDRLMRQRAAAVDAREFWSSCLRAAGS